MIRVFQTVRAAPAVQAASVWMETRSRREQRLVIAMTCLAIVAVGWYGVAQPILRMREAATVRIETAAVLLARLQAAPVGGATIGQVAAVQAPLDGPVADVLATRASAAGLTPTRIEPDSDGASVVINNARYDAVIPFVATIEGVDGALVRDVRIEQAGQPGLVRLQMRVSQP